MNEDTPKASKSDETFKSKRPRTNRRPQRPWLSPYNDNMPDLYYQLRSQGETVAQCARKLGVSKKTIYNWAKDENKPDFISAFKAGQDAAQAFYEDKLKEFIESGAKPAQEKLLQFMLRTQFREDWTETKQSTLEITDKTKDMSKGELEKFVQEKINRLLGLKPDLKAVKKDGS